MNIKLLSKIFIFFYLIHHVFPYFGTSDKVHVQTLYLGALSLISIIAFLYNKNLKNNLLYGFNKLPIIVFLIFVLWSLITIFPAINKSEALIQSSYYLIQFVSFLFILNFLNILGKDFFNFAKWMILFLIIVEITPSFFSYFSDIINSGAPSPRSLIYRGTSGNVNILAYSLLFKIPFLYYFTIKSKKKLIYSVLIFLVGFVIIQITKSRSAILTLLVITFLFLLFSNLRIKDDLSKKIKLIFNKNYLLMILSPIFFVVIVDYYLEDFAFKDTNAFNSIERISSLATGDYSTDSRLRYYKQATETIIKNPIFGIGTGNWEITSVQKDSENIDGYIVPYHVHNDFLEITAESGLLGGLLYFFVIFYIIFLLIRKIIIQIKLSNDHILPLTLLLGLISYLFDALFNFPSARPLQQINLFFILSISIIYLNTSVRVLNFKNINLILSILLLITPLSIYSAYKVFDSSKDQKILLQYFNSSGQMPLEKDYVESIKSNYPNLSITTMPISSIQGIYYYNIGEKEKALNILKESLDINPYLGLNEIFIGKIYLERDSIELAEKYIKAAYDKIPNNDLHISEYFKILVSQKDSTKVKEIYTNVKDRQQIHDELYLSAMARITDGNVSNFAMDGFNFYPESKNGQAAQGYYALKIGFVDMIEAATQHIIAERLFEEKKYDQALPLFKMAAELNPYEIPYRENYANTLMQLNRDQEAIDIINEIEIDEGTLSSKSLYIRFLSNISLNNTMTACLDLRKLLVDKIVSEEFYYNFCN